MYSLTIKSLTVYENKGLRLASINHKKLVYCTIYNPNLHVSKGVLTRFLDEQFRV